MNFATALFNMSRGHKIKRKHWKGYWYLKDGEVIMHTREGKELNIKETNDIMYTLGNCACDDWEMIERDYE